MITALKAVKEKCQCRQLRPDIGGGHQHQSQPWVDSENGFCRGILGLYRVMQAREEMRGSEDGHSQRLQSCNMR